MRLTKLFFFLILVRCIEQAYAEHVLPVFSGSWYTDIKPYSMNSCKETFYHYDQLFFGSPRQMATMLLATPPIRTDCSWQEPELTGVIDSVPPGLGYEDASSDWEKISGKGLPQSQTWRRRCIRVEKDGDTHTIDAINTKFHPQYICPNGSIIGMDYFTSITGCTTHPKPCSADVVGRDNMEPIIYKLGHIGITTGFNYVDPFKNKDSSVIHAQESGIHITDFSSDYLNNQNAIFWGVKHGINGIDLNFLESLRIIAAADAQREFPFEYTKGWEWHPGSQLSTKVYDPYLEIWKTQDANVSAKFRCDSFVFYVYSTEGKYIVPEFKKFLYPKDLFNAMFACRNSSGSLCLKNSVEKDNKTLAPTTATATHLTTLLASDSINIEDLDRASYNYVYAKDLSRTQKIQHLWTLMKDNRNRKEIFEYLGDILPVLSPIELNREIQDFYKENQISWLHKKLIDVLFETIAIKKNNRDAKIFLEKNKDNIQSALAFIHQQLMTTQENEVRDYILQRYLNLFPQENLAADLTELKKQNHLTLYPPFLWRLLIESAFIERQKNANALIDLIKKEGEGEEFPRMLCSMLHVYSNTTLTTHEKKFIAEYFNSHPKPPFAINDSVLPSCNLDQTLEKLK